MMVMFAFLAVMMILVIVMMRVWRVVNFAMMSGVGFVVIVDDHLIYPRAKN